jgi:anti-sigma regulatory factor (Ser/Thr protein kinase)
MLGSAHQIIFPKQATINYVDNFLRAVREVRSISKSTILFDLRQTTELSSIFVCFICGLVDLAREFENEVEFKLPSHRKTADTLRAIKKIVPKAGRPALMLAERMCQLRKITSNNSGPIQEIVELTGARLGMSQDLKDDAQLLLNELLTNAIDHGRSECYVCAGTWGKSEFVHFTVLDFGVGIPAKLRSMFPFLESDFSAVSTLLEKGLTTRIGREGGKGYKFVQDIMRRTRGRFSIYSGDAKASYRYDRGEYIAKKAHRTFGGTCVDLAFNLDHKGTIGAESESPGGIFG